MKNCNEAVNGELGLSRPCGLLAFSYTLIISNTACFVSSLTLVHMNSTFFLLESICLSSLSFSFAPCQCVYVYMCICQSAKTPWGNWAFATPPYHKCEGIVNISAADGADAPSLPPSQTQRRQSKWIAINSSRSCPRPRLEQGTQGLDCCSGRQFYRQILSDYQQQGNCTTLGMTSYKVILPDFMVDRHPWNKHIAFSSRFIR